jgi:hypothetical protein
MLARLERSLAGARSLGSGVASGRTSRHFGFPPVPAPIPDLPPPELPPPTAWVGMREVKRKRDRLSYEIRYRYQYYVRNAAAAGRKFELDIAEAVALFKDKCFFCGQPPTSRLNGIDRLDNSRGYERDNCRSACWTCNRMKGTASMDEFRRACVAVATNHPCGPSVH